MKHPDWPTDPWAGLKRLLLMLLQHTSAAPAAAHPAGPRAGGAAKAGVGGVTPL